MSSKIEPVPVSNIEAHQESLAKFFDDNKVPDESRFMFAYYHMQAPGNSLPEWTWQYFDRGIAKVGSYKDESGASYDLERVDGLGRLLIPNFDKRSGGLTPLLDVLKPLADDMTEVLEHGSLLVTFNHPTLASPIFASRSLVAALQDNIPDIQTKITTTYGELPTVFKYDFGEFGVVSPVGVATAIGNVALTAAVSDSNMQPELQQQQTVVREMYKANIGHLLAQAGNVVVVVVNGQRDVAFSKANPRARRINHPEGDVDIFLGQNVHMLNIAMYDRLLVDPINIGSPVQMYPDMRIRKVSKKLLMEAHKFQATSLQPETFDGSQYSFEWKGDLKIRISDRKEALKKYLDSVRGKED